jgi:hypothetical protein
MNQTLLREIVFHIYAHFGILPSDFINVKTSTSLLDPRFLLKEKLTFEIEGSLHKGKIWGGHMALLKQEVQVLVADCGAGTLVYDFAMIVQAKEAPTYGLYLSDDEEDQALIGVSVDQGKNWMPANTGLQATFLAAMEQLRDLQMPWKKIEEYQSVHQALISFVKFHQRMFA